MNHWFDVRVLILGKTYPSYSRKYGETACTGGIREDTMEMVRLYPIPERYLKSDSEFSAFQWVKFRARKDPRDPRPESLRIDFRSIEIGETIPPEKSEERRYYLENCRHLVGSVEELKERQEASGTSLGIVVPKEITSCSLKARSEVERSEWAAKESEIFQQGFLFGEKLKPIDFPEVEFQVSWVCSRAGCHGHTMNLLQWGIHQLYRKYKGQEGGEKKIIGAMRERLDLSKRDVFLFLGNFRGIQYNFGLMDSYSPPRRTQLGLF